MQIWPAIDLRGGKCVRLMQGDYARETVYGDDPAAMAESVYNFEDSIARKVSWDRATRRNRDLTYTALTPEELGGLSASFPTAEFLSASGFGETDRFIVGDMPPSAERMMIPVS